MALAKNAAAAAERLASLSIPRQLGFMFGLAACVAIAVGVVLWSRQPSYLPLFNEISSREAADVVEVLERNKVDFKVDPNQGVILVAADEVQNARLKLAAAGLPRGNNAGYELLAEKNGFTTSQFMENARYKQALEIELARTISQFHDVKSARVHLAIPRESAFVRDNRKPSASVFIDVYPGVEVKKQTIASIINLVASSIPSLSASRVTVVDQNGQLLSEGAGQNLFSETERFMDYRQSLEQQYVQKIQDILTPILGFGRVKAKVAADMDFTAFEQTQEVFNPESSAVRSEQTLEEKRNQSSASGVPGALSNTPPANPTLQQNKNGNNNANNNNNKPGNTNQASTESGDVRSQTTKNYELDKTISHTKNQPGVIKRLTVAVLVDNKTELNPQTKKMENKPLSQAELDQIKVLVADAIGLNPKRGDSLNVVNSHFVKPEPIPPLPDLHFWQKDSFWSIVKQAGAGFLILALIFGIFRPLFKNLLTTPKEEIAEIEDRESNQEGQTLLPHANDYESQLALLRQVVDKEPKRVAQVVKTWVERG
ncbi:flagellar MS-ring protein [Legionella jordanis]|uniref:Flagellar M-ring protein n=1 Tax=Legionella jordanis TaxID=456 RepID=A0A0W0V8Q6_9GAMM|nr:flagellar basal-body MS-ring/collar protein FliF [Legionella jordanis]KTD16468.1 flagellar MS-ring protein [Legionella jordanis]RMX15272.1 flagellar basal body M-ring protein FliF [Legionella jordanis]VEH12072.1 flagellar M-ring protein FliF [Legionella jordanis]